MDSFSLWLEFESFEGGYPGPEDDPECDFCNVQVRIGSLLYAANVWTFRYVARARMEDSMARPLSQPSQWLLPPDLLVSRLDRATISTAMSELIESGAMPESWLVVGGE